VISNTWNEWTLNLLNSRLEKTYQVRAAYRWSGQSNRGSGRGTLGTQGPRGCRKRNPSCTGPSPRTQYYSSVTHPHCIDTARNILAHHLGRAATVSHDLLRPVVYIAVHNVYILSLMGGRLHNNISRNGNKDKSILMYHNSFIVKRCSDTCFGLQEVIIRPTYRNVCNEYMRCGLQILTIP
jgi:hypothetical protein